MSILKPSRAQVITDWYLDDIAKHMRRIPKATEGLEYVFQSATKLKDMDSSLLGGSDVRIGAVVKLFTDNKGNQHIKLGDRSTRFEVNDDIAVNMYPTEETAELLLDYEAESRVNMYHQSMFQPHGDNKIGVLVVGHGRHSGDLGEIVIVEPDDPECNEGYVLAFVSEEGCIRQERIPEVIIAYFEGDVTVESYKELMLTGIDSRKDTSI